MDSAMHLLAKSPPPRKSLLEVMCMGGHVTFKVMWFFSWDI